MKKCPYCGEEIPDDTIFCRFCRRSLVNEPVSRPLGSGSPVLGLVLITVVLLLIVLLFGFSLFQLSPALAGVFYLLASFVLGVMAARGRYPVPILRHYLLSVLIALIPVVGTIYSVVFAARYAAQSRSLRLALIGVLLLSLLFALLIGSELGERFNLDDLTARLQRSPTAEITVDATPTRPAASATPRASASASPESAATGETQPSDTPAPLPMSDECLPWDQVTLDMVSQKMCVYGNYLEYYQRPDGGWALAFSQDPGTFQVWSPETRPMEMLVPRDGGTCVQVYGWVKTSGIRPIIIVKPIDISPCP